MSYTPVGLFNHTAAIYQMLTGYTADKVSPSGQLEPPTPKDFPNVGSQHHPAQAADRADAAVRDDAAAAAGEQRRRQGRHAPASWAGPTIPTLLYPPGDDMDMTKMDRIKIDDLQAPRTRCRRRAWNAGPSCANVINEGMPDLEKATAKYDLDEYYGKALGLVISGRARNAFDLTQGNAGRCASATAGTRSANAACWPAG